MKLARRLRSALITIGGLLRHFVRRQRFFLLPFLVVLLAAALLLALTGGLSFVAPFLYTLF